MALERRETIEHLRDKLRRESSDGARLVGDPQDNPICAVSFDHSIPAIAVVWRRYATSAQIRFILEHVLELLRSNRATKILGDDTALATIDADDQQWIVSNWMPRAVAAGLKTCATKGPSSHFGRVSVRKVHSDAPNGLVLKAFDDLAEARQWLATVN